MKTRPLATMSNGHIDVGGLPLAMARGAPPQLLGGISQPHQVAEISSIKATAKILKFDSGLYALSIAETGESSREHSGILLPAVQISNPPSDRFGTAEIVAASGESGFWLGPEGGTVVIKAPLGGGHVLIATYEPSDRPGIPLEIEVRRLDRPTQEAGPTETGTILGEHHTREIKIEILLHIERAGDRRVPAQGWVGSRGKKLRIEAFSICPIELLAARDIEYKAFGPDGRETPWVSDANLCGTRGRSMPLTGFAIRLVPHLRERFDIEYLGAFFESGVSDTIRNGEPCTARITNDPLEAMNLRLIERATS